MSALREGEIAVDSQRTANLLNEHRRLWAALQSIEQLEEAADLLQAASREARDALALEPEYDALPQFVEVDPSWADALASCAVCGRDVPWAEAVLMPCGAAGDQLGLIHRFGCAKDA